jgi:hypothetical protein
MQIELAAKIRDVIVFLTMRRYARERARCAILNTQSHLQPTSDFSCTVSGSEHMMATQATQNRHWGFHGRQSFALPDSCSRLFDGFPRSQFGESFQRNVGPLLGVGQTCEGEPMGRWNSPLLPAADGGVRLLERRCNFSRVAEGFDD